MGDKTRLGCNEEKGTKTNAKIIDYANRSEEVEYKIDIITPDKTNKNLY